ncbi:MAG: hypothetical protein SPI15_04880 [Candidatus Faecousia sp.]|nr:hypothetical protein [Clostridiales bacterium]MDY6180169.1 hypothetical protein [Candidatus Faecousia sp.]
MENFKEKLKIQNLVSAIAGFFLVVFCLLSAAGEAGILPFLTPAAGDSHWQSMWRGFVSGASFAILAFLVFGLVRNIRALRSEQYLKKLYVKEHDERSIQVWTSARAAAFQAFLLLGLVAIVAAGYFSVTVSLTILGCLWFASIIALLFKVYYSKKF